MIKRLLCAALLLSGCASIQITRSLEGQALDSAREPVAHVHAQNWGLYIFNWIPLMCGNPRDTGFGTVLFANRTRSQDAADMVLRTSKDLGATATVDLQSRTSSSWVPATLFWIRRAEASGNACK